LIIESILIVAFALGLDFAVGDPKNKFHPTAWIGKLVSILTPHAKKSEKLGDPNLGKCGRYSPGSKKATGTKMGSKRGLPGLASNGNFASE